MLYMQSENEKVQQVIAKLDNYDRDTCKKCGSKDLEMKNFNQIWRDADLYCRDCGAFVRVWDPN